ncbi:hypothetical protein AM1H77_06730 [Apilactobacillus micheneri]
MSAGFIPNPNATNTDVTIKEINVFSLHLIIKNNNNNIPNTKTKNGMLNYSLMFYFLKALYN